MDESWTIEKNHGLLSAVVFFSIPAVLFLFTFTLNYLILRATDLFSLVLPLIFAPIAAISVPTMVRALKEYPEQIDFRLNDEGVYRKSGNEDWKGLSWAEIKQYDGVLKKSHAIFGFPQKIYFRNENEVLEVLAFEDEMNLLMGEIYNHDIPFGYVRAAK